MRRCAESPLVVVLLLSFAAFSNESKLIAIIEEGIAMAAPIVFFDIAGSNDSQLREFYSDIFGWSFSKQSQTTVDVIAPLEGAIRKDPSGKRIYIGVENVTDTLQKIVEYGGSVDAPRFEVPGMVVLGLFKDPAGNEMGLVEIDGEKQLLSQR